MKNHFLQLNNNFLTKFSFIFKSNQTNENLLTKYYPRTWLSTVLHQNIKKKILQLQFWTLHLLTNLAIKPFEYSGNPFK